MLNDFLSLRDGAVALGLDPEPGHPMVQSPRRMEALRVVLDAAGRPVGVGRMEADEISALWTFRDGNHNGFPFVVHKGPLLVADDPSGDVFESDWQEADAAGRRALLERATVTLSPAAMFGAKDLQRCRERAAALAEIADESACVPVLLERGARAMADPDLARRIAETICQEVGDLDLARAAIVGPVKETAFWFDAEGHSAASRRHVSAIVEALSEGGGAAAGGICALTGEEGALYEGSFPQPNLPTLGKVLIHARNVDAIPAAIRYADRGTFRVGAALPSEMAGALRRLATERWSQSIPGERDGQRDLLIAYAEVDLPVLEALAEEPSREDELRDVREGYKSAMATVIEAVEKGEITGVNDSVTSFSPEKVPVRVLVLRKVDPGNTKVIVHRGFTAADLLNAALRWTAASDNLPGHLSLPVRAKSGKVVSGRAFPVVPLALPGRTKTTYLRGGTERAKAPPAGMTAADALALFLGDPGAKALARAALSDLMRRQGDLMTGAAHALRRGGATGYDHRAALGAAGLAGLFLAFADRKKEEFMSDTAYDLGVLFSALDEIHAGYCADMRGGDFPPTLMGSEFFAVAQRDPVKALALLSGRIKPYKSWLGKFRFEETESGWRVTKDAVPFSLLHRASTEKEREHQARLERIVRTALGARRPAEELCRKVAPALPTAADLDETFLAVMTLGYMAGREFPGKRRKDETPQDEETEE